MHRTPVFPLLLLLAMTGVAIPTDVRGQYAQVYGGPEYTPGADSYYKVVLSGAGDMSVNDQGLAIANALLAKGAGDLGLRPIAWGPAIGVQIMEILGTDRFGISQNSVTQLSDDGAAFGYLTVYEQGREVSGLAVR